MFIYYFLIFPIFGYPGGAPGFDYVLNNLQPGGPHTDTWFRRKQYGYNHHHIRLHNWDL